MHPRNLNPKSDTSAPVWGAENGAAEPPDGGRRAGQPPPASRPGLQPWQADPSAPPLRPRVGVRVDRGRLDYELARRGLSAREFGARAGLSEVVLSHARTGRAVREATLRKIAAGLTAIPELPGAVELLAAPPSQRAPAA